MTSNSTPAYTTSSLTKMRCGITLKITKPMGYLRVSSHTTFSSLRKTLNTRRQMRGRHFTSLLSRLSFSLEIRLKINNNRRLPIMKIQLKKIT